MNDILLTDYGTVIGKATSEWMNGKGGGMSLEDYTARAVAIAQLAKACEWCIPQVEAALAAITPPRTLCSTAAASLRGLLQSLRAAGGASMAPTEGRVERGANQDTNEMDGAAGGGKGKPKLRCERNKHWKSYACVRK